MGLALGRVREQPREAAHSNNSARARAQARALARVLALALALDRQAQGPDRPGPAWTMLPGAKAPRVKPRYRFGPQRRWGGVGWRRKMLGVLGCFACLWLLEARRATW